MQEEQKRVNANALMVGLNLMSSEDIRVPARDIETLVVFKDIIRAILNGQLILATPDRILPEGVELPKTEVKEKE